MQNSQRRAGELIIRFREGVSEQDKDATVNTRGIRRKKMLRGQSRLEKLELVAGQEPEALAEELRSLPAVELVEPNFLISRDEITPDDPRFSEQWALKNIGQNGGVFGSDIGAAPAWETTTGAQTTIVAIIDSGVDFTHPDLRNNQWANSRERDNGRDDDRNGFTDDLHGWDWIANDNSVHDEQGHGTAIAGIIAAQGNNGIGITGVMWKAALMSLRVLDNTGTGELADAVEAIDYAVDHGAQVINCSWGTDQESAALRDAIERAGRAGVVVVTSAGNSGRDIESVPYYPASYGLPNQIAVAATDKFDILTTWSNWGAAHATIAAPGTDILTTRIGGGYTTVTGTSASTPLVTGVIGLIKTQRWWLSAAGTRAAIVDGARRVEGLTGKVSSGGVINASGALGTLRGPNTIPTENGNGNNGNNGGGNGGNPPNQPPIPRRGSGGAGQGGSFSVTPPPAQGTPAINLPNLDRVRRSQNTVTKAPAPISSNLPCVDCDPGGGGGGGAYEPPNDPRYSTSRTLPPNETGQPNVDLGSRNFNWSLPILNLAGRSGLDLNLSLTYNSLLWTRQDAGIKYNADRGFPGPGFRLGFPTVQQRYYNSHVGIWAYMMVTPSGARVELRQVNGSNVYEAHDGSYTQLIDYGNGTALVRTTDGTQWLFVTYNGEMRCTQVKDRNGNYITINYNGYGHITTIIDTLGRVVSFNYDADQNLTSITQPWDGQIRTWATFYYGPLYIQPNFPGLSVNGPNYAYQTVLTRVTLSDGFYHDFTYNSWGQVYQISLRAPDTHLLSYVKYNLPQDSSVAQSDCPRFTERRDWAENWNGSAEAVTAYSVSGDGAWSQATTPDGTIYREYFAATGWQKGLTTQTEIWSGGVKRKWTTISWTQDNIYLNYPQNPRVTETNVYDAEGNRKRTTIGYTYFNLPSDVYEYGADAVSVLRRTHTDYRFDSAYIDRRIIGLVDGVYVYDGANNLASKVRYDYDWPHFPSLLQSTPAPATQHDAANYGQSFCYGRGNKVWEMRYDVTDPDNTNKGTDHIWSYYTTGSIIYSRDPSGHAVNISYTDSFSDGVNRNTFAYPTTVTDPDNYSLTTQYSYDMGAVTRTQSPPPAGQSQGAIQTMEYDVAGRISRVNNLANGAYRRWFYDPYGAVLEYTTVQAGLPETFSVTYFDGAGRMVAQAGDLPNSAGLYRGQYTFYDVMGRASQTSNLTEISGSWIPSGDDAAGWAWTYQHYDWQGRPTLTIFPSTDGGQTSHTRENTYGGCGCAGGEVTTVRDERGRRRRMTTDVLGRLKKVEELNWDQSVYSTTEYTYNARNQITNINQMGQVRSFEYDGYGRLWRKTTPEQGQTTYSYFADDTVQTMTDARGATSTFTYNGRHLPTSITYGVPAGVAATPNVSFTYDAAGNRTSMTDGLGSVAYHYDQLSRMDWEERSFTGLGTYRLSYAYNLADQLTSVTGPSQFGNINVGYTYDKIGRTTAVTGSGYTNLSSYVSSLSYRAFGGVKQINYSNTRQLSVQYDKRLRMTRWDVGGVLGYQYQYLWEETFRPTFASNLYDPTLDRYYDNDHVGRLHIGRSGSEARAAYGLGWNGQYDGPYSTGLFYDVWGNLTYKEGWGGVNPAYTATFTNNRRNGFSYDAAGNLTNDGQQTYSYDATGQQVYASGTGLTQSYDGDGLRVRKVENGATTYYLRSSVLGNQVVAEFSGSGAFRRGYVYLGGQLLALQENNQVSWVHQEPITKGQRLTNSAGTVFSTVELDPWGGETSRSVNPQMQPHRFTSYERDDNGGDEAMFRRYEGKWQRFAQPDPYDGSYNLTAPQSFNRYSYVQSDPVNFVDPSGLFPLALLLLPLAGAALGGGISAGWSALSQGITNGFSNINWNDVWIAGGVGAAAGAIAPFVYTPGGAALLYGVANFSQNFITARSHGELPTPFGLLFSLGTGALAGRLSGGYLRPGLPYVRNPLPWVQGGNRYYWANVWDTLTKNVAPGAVARNAAGTGVSFIPDPTAQAGGVPPSRPTLGLLGPRRDRPERTTLNLRDSYSSADFSSLLFDLMYREYMLSKGSMCTINVYPDGRTTQSGSHCPK